MTIANFTRQGSKGGWKEVIRRSRAGVSGHFCRFSNFKQRVFHRVHKYQWRIQGGSGVSAEPPFLAGYVINLICTVKDPGFMEPPFLPFS